mgnify:CR=1 FL=1
MFILTQNMLVNLLRKNGLIIGKKKVLKTKKTPIFGFDF